ncbi:hypothetical protein B0H14DRAFT_2891759 [Mycena olivaceomarginata]|nr:hypothetical protein B0H14DRAFT_2891759 [Mycena olivaceomarginata]
MAAAACVHANAHVHRHVTQSLADILSVLSLDNTSRNSSHLLIRPKSESLGKGAPETVLMLDARGMGDGVWHRRTQDAGYMTRDAGRRTQDRRRRACDGEVFQYPGRRRRAVRLGALPSPLPRLSPCHAAAHHDPRRHAPRLRRQARLRHLYLAVTAFGRAHHPSPLTNIFRKLVWPHLAKHRLSRNTPQVLSLS